MAIPMEIQEVLAVLDSRHEMDVEILSKRIQDNFSGSMLSLKQLKPLIVEILRCFKTMPRKKRLDGTYPTIAGHRSFCAGKKDSVGWCMGVMGCNARTVRYMLAGGNKNRGTLKSKMETVSVLDISLVLRYLTTKLGTLDRANQEKLAQKLEQFVETLNLELWKTKRKEAAQ